MECATRIEKRKEACPHSPTLDEEWVKNVLGGLVCKNAFMMKVWSGVNLIDIRFLKSI